MKNIIINNNTNTLYSDWGSRYPRFYGWVELPSLYYYFGFFLNMVIVEGPDPPTPSRSWSMSCDSRTWA